MTTESDIIRVGKEIIAEAAGEPDFNPQELLMQFVEDNKELFSLKCQTKDKVLLISFQDISIFNPDLGMWFLDNFEEGKEYLRHSINLNFGEPKNPRDAYSVIITNLSKTLEKEISDIRGTDLDKLITIKGTITQVGEMFRKLYWAKYVCNECPRIVELYSVNDNIPKPGPCECGKKNSLKLKDSYYKDSQKIIVEEDTKTEIIHKLIVMLPNELCRKEMASLIRPNRKVEISGVLKAKLQKDRQTFSEYLLANYITQREDNIVNYTYTTEDVIAFQETAKSPTLYMDLAQSIIPTISGLDNVKMACLLQLFGGVPLYLQNQLEERGVIHLLLVSSPGMGKSKIMDKVIQFLPNANLSAGKTASGVGLVASIMKDEELGMTVSAGKIALATGSLSCIDELDKVNKEDLAYLNTAMVNLKVNIDKGGLHVTFDTETAILASANPKNRVFDDYEAKYKQIDIPQDIQDRFDLILPLEAPKDAEEKRKIFEMMLDKYNPSSRIINSKYPFDFLVKYINYARNNIRPRITPEVQRYLVDRYTEFCKPENVDIGKYQSNRFLMNIYRLATATAKVRLSNEVSIGDGKFAFDLFIASLEAQDAITQAGRLDYEKVENIPNKGKRDRIHIVLGIVRELCKTSPDQLASLFDMIKKAEEQGITEDELEDLIELLKKEKGLIESRSNRFQVQ